MQRITFLLMAIFAMGIVKAQDLTDGLRYSSDATSGTARFSALSGAFGALGGDLSAVDINPAGSAVFLSSNATVSLAADDTDNEANYFNSRSKSVDTDVNLNQAGGVIVIKNPSGKSKWKKFTIAFNYQAKRNYDNELFVRGTGNTSIGEFFLSQAQGIPLELLQLQAGESISDLYAYLGENEGTGAQNAFLGYQGFIIDPVDPDDPQNQAYFSNIGPGSFDHDYAFLSRGANNKFTVNIATQISDNFFFGINLNSHTINYDQSTFLFESNSNEGSTVDQVGFENNLFVDGIGFSAQLGAIAKIHNDFRIGISLESPTWFDIAEETTQYLETRRMDDDQTIFENINPFVINVFENYYIRTPGKVTASAAYIFGTSGLISFDYSYKDYGTIKFDNYNFDSYGYYSNDDFYEDDLYFDAVNDDIENSLKGVSSYKLGAEFRVKQLSLRGGLRYEESPYKNDVTIGDLKGFSLGFGYNFGNYNLDLSYARAEQKRNQQLYNVGLTDSASINTVASNFGFSLGFNF